MSLGALVERVLPNDHPPISDTLIHPAGMEGAVPWVTGIDFFAVATQAAFSPFCMQTEYRVTFETTGKIGSAPGAPESARAQSYQLAHRYVWNDPTRPKSCGDKRTADFFDVSDTDAETALPLIVRLIELQAVVRTGGPPGFPILFRDRLEDPAASGVLNPLPEDVARPATGRGAFKLFPFYRLVWFGAADDFYSNSALPRPAANETVWVIAAEEWRFYAYCSPNGKILRAVIVREWPAPF